jgi:hypothetical protein
MVLALAASTLALVELGLRVVVSVNEQTGVLVLGRLALLPWRPGDEHVRRTLAAPSRDDRYMERDDELGWALRPNGGAGMYEANASGLRGRRGETVTQAPGTGITRVAVHGDSFTHGDEVPLEHTWAAQWMSLRPNLEVLNFGVAGYGVDQAVLRHARDGTRFSAQAHVLCIWPEDIIRNLNIIRFYMTPQGELGRPKPRFVLEGDGLKLVNSPVMNDQDFADTVTGRRVNPLMAHERLHAEQDFEPRWYHASYTARAVGGLLRSHERRRARERQYFDPNSEANRLAVRIAALFKAKVESSGAKAYVAIIPAGNYLERHEAGGWPLVDLLRGQGIDVIDLGPAIARAVRAEGFDRIYLPGGHTTSLGNRRIAEAFDRAFVQRQLAGFQ